MVSDTPLPNPEKQDNKDTLDRAAGKPQVKPTYGGLDSHRAAYARTARAVVEAIAVEVGYPARAWPSPSPADSRDTKGNRIASVR
jgi:hypothetical protein